MTFGKRLRESRKEKGFTQEKAAEIIGIDHTTISKYENDRSEPDNETLNKFSSLYGVNTHWLLSGKGQRYITEYEKDQLISKKKKEAMEIIRQLPDDDIALLTEFIKRLRNTDK